MPLLIWTFALCFGTVASFIGLKNFEAWTQVIDLWETGVSPFLLTGHPHFFRFLIAYPGFLLDSELPNSGFSIYASVYFATNAALWYRLSILCKDRTPPAWSWALFLSAHMFMNGRGVIAWTAWLLCANLCLSMSKKEGGDVKHILLMMLTCWLAAVSTGIFIITVITLLLFYVQHSKHAKRRTKPSIFLVALLGVPSFAIVSEYFWVALQKNILFFGGGFAGVLNMLQHGLGQVIFQTSTLAIISIYTFALVLIVLVFCSVYGRRWTPLEQLIFLSLSGGLFGITVLTSVVPLFLIYITPKQQQRRVSRPQHTGRDALPNPSSQTNN